MGSLDMHMIRPAKLKRGDRVGVVSPSQSVHDRVKRFNRAVGVIEDTFEIKLELAPHALGKHFYSSGTVQERLDDFHQMVMDPTIKAILFGSGGYTAVELVDKLDYALIRDNPKIIAGMSDAATLLNPILKKSGLITFNGFEFASFGHKEKRAYEIEMIKSVWFEGNVLSIKPNPKWKDWRGTHTSYRGWQTIRGGQASGRIVGGTAGPFMQLTGTEYEIDYQDKILVIETYKQDKKQLHRVLADLRLWGVFDRIAGLVVGYCVGSDDPDNDYNARPMKELVLEVAEGYDFPIMQVGEIGHYVENILLPIGAKAHMNATELTFEIVEPVVS